MAEMKRTAVKFPEHMLRAIKVEANKKGVSMGHVIRECVGLRLKIKKPLRQGDKGWRPPTARAAEE